LVNVESLCRLFVGKKYSWNEFNCYTLIVKLFKELGYDIPDYQTEEGWHKRGKNYFVEEYHKLWVKIDELEIHDIILFKMMSSVPNHVGIYIGNGKFIHCQQRVGTAIGTVKRYQKFVNSYYRFKELYKCP